VLMLTDSADALTGRQADGDTERSRSCDLEVFCNRGEPTVAEIEENTLPDD
jgi:hypothetical protein